MPKGQIYVLLFVLCTHQSWGFFFRDIKEFAGNISDVIEAVKIAGKYRKNGMLVIESLNNDEQTDDETIARLKMIRRYANIELDLAIDIVKRLGEIIEITPFKAKLEECIIDIDRRFRKLLRNLEKPEEMTETWQDFSVNAFLEMTYKIRSLYNLLSGMPETSELRPGLLELLQSEAVRHRNTCDDFSFKLPHLLVDLVRAAFIVEIESLAVMSFTLPILSNEEELSEKISHEEKDSEDRRMEYLKLVTETIELPPGITRMCNPLNGFWILGQTCFEMERLVQRTIFKQPNYLRSFLTCKYQAETYNEGDKNYIAFWTTGSTCNGQLADCKGFRPFSGCVPESTAVKRFEWIKTDEGSLYGFNIGSCEVPNTELQVDDNSNCLCTCYENKNFISVEWVKSDVKNNMVITGLRFIRKHNVIYLQPKQGRLIKNGGIDPESEEWVDLPMVKDTTVPVTMEYRTFFLDDIMVPLGSVVTGIRFFPARIRHTNKELNGFKIKVQGVKFDYSTGKLCNREECMTSVESLLEERIEIDYGRMNSIYNSKVYHNTHSGSGSFVRLSPSKLEQDFGQSTVPLLDGIPLEINPPSPLGGIGIFHKSGEDSKSVEYAGFISLRGHSIDYQNYLKEFRARYKNKRT